MNRAIKHSNDLIRDKAINILRKLGSENGLDGDELALISSFCLIERVENKRLKECEDLDEQNKLLKLPCAVGDTVYVIPSETNYKLNIVNGYSENNRVYEQIVNRIEISRTGYLLSTCDGLSSVIDAFYKKTWFLAQEEAEAALKALERGEGNE